MADRSDVPGPFDGDSLRLLETSLPKPEGFPWLRTGLMLFSGLLINLATIQYERAFRPQALPDAGAGRGGAAPKVAVPQPVRPSRAPSAAQTASLSVLGSLPVGASLAVAPDPLKPSGDVR